MTLRVFASVILATFYLISIAHTHRSEMITSPDKCGGVYLAYPVKESQNTAPPKGYKPFYISHYGRHGSRYLLSDSDYEHVLRIMIDADSSNVLTSLGRDVLSRLKQVWEEAEGRSGELTPLGARQHHDIAQRMYKAFPEVFAGSPEINAMSTRVMRCAHSMFAFCEGLKELDPSLVIPRESSQRYMWMLCPSTKESNEYNRENGPWKEEFRKFRTEMTQPDRMIQTLFSDSLYVRRNINPEKLMHSLYWIAVDMQNMETPVSFYDIFLPEELFNLWRIFNYSFYIHNASFPLANAIHVDNAKPLLRHILETAESYIKSGKNGATLRFGHDGNIIPLAALMRIPGCYGYEIDPAKVHEAWSDFSISPMASNLQLIFFRNNTGDVIVKFMLNECEVEIPCNTDMFPFYRWNDVKTKMLELINIPAATFIPTDRR